MAPFRNGDALFRSGDAPQCANVILLDLYHDLSNSSHFVYRRKKKGSSHHSHKKTTAQGASVKKALASSNKGHQLLSKMGWSEGKGLGKSDQGIVEPIQVGLL